MSNIMAEKIKDNVLGNSVMRSLYHISSQIHSLYGYETYESFIVFIMQNYFDNASNIKRQMVIQDELLFGDDIFKIKKNKLESDQNLYDILSNFVEVDTNSKKVNMCERLDFYIEKKYLKVFTGADLFSKITVNTNGRKSQYFDAHCHFSYLKESVDAICQNSNPISVSIFGYARSVLGLGEDARRLCDVLISIGCRVEIIDYSYDHFPISDQWCFYRGFQTEFATASIHIFCMPLLEICKTFATSAYVPNNQAYLIAFAPWELNEVPRPMRHFATMFDEVWCSSEFQKNVYSQIPDLKITSFPFYIRYVEPHLSKSFRQHLSIENFNFGCAFDYNSTTSRKNPSAVLKAFSIAFPRHIGNVRLIIKTIHGDKYEKELLELLAIANNDARIVFLDGPIDDKEMAGFLKNIDVFVSLHRSEGFGRILAESMLQGTPVISTNWSGSADFVNNDCGFPIDYSLKPVESSAYPMAIGSWAEPDVNHAASVMIHAFNNRHTIKVKSVLSNRLILEKYSLHEAANATRRALRELSMRK